MYSDVSPSADFDSMGFIAQKNLKNFMMVIKLLLEQDKQLRIQIKSLSDSISRKHLEYDENKTLSAEEFEKA